MSKANSNRPRWKIAIVGEIGVGKTSLISRYMDNKFSDNNVTTIGIEEREKSVNVRGSHIKLLLYDTQGQEVFRNLTAGFFKGAQAVIVVYDISDKNSFDRVDFWLSNVRDSIKSKVIIALCGSKSDLEKVRKVSTEDGKSKAAQENILFYETSAMNGSGVNEMMESVLDSVGDFLFPERQTSSANLVSNKPVKRRACNIL